MSLTLKGYILLPVHKQEGGFDHAAVHQGKQLLYVAHTANDAVDVIDCSSDRYLRSMANLAGVAGALVSEESNLVFTSNRGEDSVSIFSPDAENQAIKIRVGIRPKDSLLTQNADSCLQPMLAILKLQIHSQFQL